ncbi:mRNA cap guanine-N7 methyltransferase-like [Ornithodoros turicata]
MASAMPEPSKDGADEPGIAPIVQNHYNSLENGGLEQRQQSRIFHMRNFNNWVKSMLIRDFINKRKEDKPDGDTFTVLDLGAGKGGDLLKWKKGDISYLVCADIAGTSLQHAEERYRDMEGRHRRQRERGRMFKAEFIEADCTKVLLAERYKRGEAMQFDLVSCQFTLHYSFESLPQAQCMLRNAADCLLPGGFFIGTTPDAYDLVRRVQESDGLSFGNDVFSVTFQNKEEFPLFGARYDFHLEGVVDCPEFLVHIDLLKELARGYGMELVYKKRFEDFFDQFKEDSEGRMLLRKMQALETYPPGRDCASVGNVPQDYEYAAQEVERLKGEAEGHNDKVQVGTLSKAEWEALSIYIVFAFQKK